MYTTGTSASPCPTPIHLPSFKQPESQTSQIVWWCKMWLRRWIQVYRPIDCPLQRVRHWLDYQDNRIQQCTGLWQSTGHSGYCRGKIRCSFGIGTNLTNDTGFKPSNIVMKLSQCKMNLNQEWRECVKLSDDIGNISATRKRYVPVYTISRLE